MITPAFNGGSGQPLYEQLYRHIRRAIEDGTLRAGERLPSKRMMADHLRVSLRTIENAYAQLTVEGYVTAEERKAYYVRQVTTVPTPWVSAPPEEKSLIPHDEAGNASFDLKTNKVAATDFPFSVWTRLMRKSLRNRDASWLEPSHPQGHPALRREIVSYLRQFRGIDVDADQVVLGAGSEYLLGLIAELMPGSRFALENPNYHKPANVLRSRGVAFEAIAMDDEGIQVDFLESSTASVALTAPSHHFPLGTVMSANRRMQLLQWAARSAERYLIEDDYDSEFRFALKPIPSLRSLDCSGKVIYMNTFTRTLAPALRIAYLVLPPQLLEQYRRKLMFYACPVSGFEQVTLRDFLSGGYYERHLNRIRTVYRSRRDALLRGLRPLAGGIEIRGQQAGLHLLVTSRNGLTERQLIDRAMERGVRVYGLSAYYLDPPEETHTVIVGYAGYETGELACASGLLTEAWQH